MLPPKAGKFLGRITNFGFALGLIPYRWNYSESKMEFVESKMRYFLILFHLSLQGLYQFYLVSRCLVTMTDDQIPKHKGIIIVYTTGMYLFPDVNHFVTIKHYGVVHGIINNAMSISKTFKGKCKVSDNQDGKALLIFMKVLAFAAACGSTINIVGCLNKPDSIQLLTSLADQPLKVSILNRSLIGCLHFYLQVSHFYGLVFYASLVFCYQNTVLTLINCMRFKNDSRSVINTFHSHNNCLNVLDKHSNHTFGFWTLGIQMLFLHLVICNFFLAVSFHYHRGLIFGFTGTFIILQIFQRFARVYEDSRVVIASWVFIQDKWFRKYAKACQPLHVRIGSFYFADKSLILTILSIIFTNTSNLIITYKPHE